MAAFLLPAGLKVPDSLVGPSIRKCTHDSLDSVRGARPRALKVDQAVRAAATRPGLLDITFDLSHRTHALRGSGRRLDSFPKPVQDWAYEAVRIR